MAIPRAALRIASGVALTLILIPGGSLPAGADRGEHRQRCVRSLTAGVQTIEVSFAGTAYPVRIVVPDGVASRAALPLVLDLHGSSSNGFAQAPISDLTSLAQSEKFLVANPSGAIALAPQNPPLPDGSWAWNVPGVPTTAGELPPPGARDDVAYLATVVKAIDKLACVDDGRVYATGYSGGGRMASALACRLAGTFAAVAPVAGLRAGRPSLVDPSVPEVQDCTPSRPVPVITFHGDADQVNPILGNGDLRWGYAVAVAAQTWARLDGCRQGPAAEATGQIQRFSYSQCRGGADVVYYKVAGGGHTWPGSQVEIPPLGNTTQEIDASELMWEFFKAHPRR